MFFFNISGVNSFFHNVYEHNEAQKTYNLSICKIKSLTLKNRLNKKEVMKTGCCMRNIENLNRTLQVR